MATTDLKRWTIRAAALLAAALLGAGIAAGVLFGLDDDSEPTSASASTAETTTEAAGSPQPAFGSGLTINQIYERSASAVVEIRAGQTAGGRATGTGFVIDADGSIVTNQHVVGDADSVVVEFADGETEQARVVGTDPSTDLALLTADVTAHDVRPVDLGASEGVKVGDPVVAIGNPFGLERTVTAGIVSAVDRDIEAPNGFTINGAIQTDAPINPGNSGGPLFDSGGRVIGVTAQIASETGGNVGIGYAVPSDTVREIVDELSSGGEVQHAYLGVRIQETDDGVRIEVVEGGPADEAGLQSGDVVVSVGGNEVESASDVTNAVDDLKPGDTLRLEVTRGGSTRTVTVTLAERPASAG